MKSRKLWLFAAIVIAILILNHWFGWSEYLGDARNLEFLERLVQRDFPLAVAIYIAMTIVGSVVLALPGITFAIFAGLLFGPVLGTVFCSLATTAGAVIAFLVGRFFLKDSIKPVAMKNPYLKKWLFDESGNHELFVLMITRLVPLFPYNLQNFAYGVTDISFWKYAVGSFVFMLPGTAMYTVGTAGLVDEKNRALYIGVAVLLAAAVTGLGLYFKKRYVQEETDEEAK